MEKYFGAMAYRSIQHALRDGQEGRGEVATDRQVLVHDGTSLEVRVVKVHYTTRLLTTRYSCEAIREVNRKKLDLRTRSYHFLLVGNLV